VTSVPRGCMSRSRGWRSTALEIRFEMHHSWRTVRPTIFRLGRNSSPLSVMQRELAQLNGQWSRSWGHSQSSDVKVRCKPTNGRAWIPRRAVTWSRVLVVYQMMVKPRPFSNVFDTRPLDYCTKIRHTNKYVKYSRERYRQLHNSFKFSYQYFY